MLGDHASRDANSVTTLLAVSNIDGVTPVLLWADPTTHRLLVQSSGGSSNYATAETPSGTIDGVNGTFTLAHTPTDNPLLVVQTAIQYNGNPVGTNADFTISGSTITFAAGSIPSSGAWMLAWYHY